MSKPRTNPHLAVVIQVVSEFYGLSDVALPVRSYPYNVARGLICYLMYERVNGAEIGRQIGLERNTVRDRYRAIKAEVKACPKGATAVDLRLIENELNQKKD